MLLHPREEGTHKEDSWRGKVRGRFILMLDTVAAYLLGTYFGALDMAGWVVKTLGGDLYLLYIDKY